MIDIHTHMLPAIDDGANEIGETLEMLEKSVAMGVSEVIFTPHGNTGEFSGLLYKEQILEAYHYVCEFVQLQNMNLKLHLGMEVMANRRIKEAWYTHELLTLASTDYLLIEFPFNAGTDYAFGALKSVEECRLKPIIAHPERYELIIHNPEIAYEWNKRGYILQINSGSILGEFGEKVRRTAHILLDHQLAQLIASDCHHSDRRGPNLNSVKQLLTRDYSSGYADLLLTINPKLLLANQPILIINPQNPLR
ncbi:tyrosine-protein phosphatase [Enterococcus sp. AZ109]|uniref:tyrosine-protein phosphatase n=1 Tax=Enterococcus sp. AZ109 TaxID=2774634 RepID=UPI003F204990